MTRLVPHPHRPADGLLGIAAMCAAMTCFIVSDVFTKLATARLPVGETILLRGLMSAAVFAVPVLVSGSWTMLRRRFSLTWAARVGAEMAGATSFVMALSLLPIANVVALSQTSVIVLTLVGARLLGERVGVVRWAAALVGFAGVLLIVRPGRDGFTWWSVLPLVTMLAMVGRDLATRMMAKDVPATLITWTTALGVAAGGLLLAPFDGAWIRPDLATTGHLAAAALFVAIAYFFSIEAVRRAELSLVAPFRYTILPLSLLAGWLVWAEVPDFAAFAGILVIGAAGLASLTAELRRRT